MSAVNACIAAAHHVLPDAFPACALPGCHQHCLSSRIGTVTLLRWGCTTCTVPFSHVYWDCNSLGILPRLQQCNPIDIIYMQCALCSKSMHQQGTQCLSSRSVSDSISISIFRIHHSFIARCMPERHRCMSNTFYYLSRALPKASLWPHVQDHLAPSMPLLQIRMCLPAHPPHSPQHTAPQPLSRRPVYPTPCPAHNQAHHPECLMHVPL